MNMLLFLLLFFLVALSIFIIIDIIILEKERKIQPWKFACLRIIRDVNRSIKNEKTGYGTHTKKPPKSPKAKYNQILEANKEQPKKKPKLKHNSVKDVFQTAKNSR